MSKQEITQSKIKRIHYNYIDFLQLEEEGSIIKHNSWSNSMKVGELVVLYSFTNDYRYGKLRLRIGKIIHVKTNHLPEVHTTIFTYYIQLQD